ncbi:formin-like protein 5 [Arachis stenosperma]|uniref:formin-like protein 5 n=1 Tax=Arachis stenosperma TaxID=217475 RepID=UPI0025ACD87F|nr:formin-like protein 5 [Arachis stenosperma]
MMQQGEKLKRSFKVTCSKCGATGHNYKTCKGTPSDLNWKPKTKKAKKGSTSQALTILPLSQSAPTDSDAPSTQDHSIPTQPPMPDVTPGPSNPVAATAVAPQVKPGPVTRRTHFRPPLQVPSTTHQNAQATQSEMRPKQRIFRPPAPLNPSPLPPQSQPNPPGPHPPQVIPGPNAAATQETLAPTSTTTTGMFKFIPNPPSIVPKK